MDMKDFDSACELLPEGVTWDEAITPCIVKHIAKAAIAAQAQQNQEIGEMRENGVNWYGKNPHAFAVGTKFFALPPAPEGENPSCRQCGAPSGNSHCLGDIFNCSDLAAPEYQEPEQLCDDGGKCGAGGYCNNCAAPVVKENGKLRERLANQHAKIEQLRASLQECLDRAIGFLNDEIGVKPNELFDYNGWDEIARNLLSQDIRKDE